MPTLGTPSTGAPNSLTYGSFGNTKQNVINIKVENDEDNDATDVDSGMSSEENEDSLKTTSNVSNEVGKSVSVDKQEVIKCLNKPQENRNVIPCSSNDANAYDKTLTPVVANEVSCVVIDLTCNVDNESDSSRSDVNDCRIDCDSSEPSVVTNLTYSDSSDSVETSLVPVGNNEIVRRENEKLLSLSLSILLAALLQAMRCFAQFLEDIIVIPHR